MSGLEKSLFQLKFTAKQLNKQAAKAGKDENAEKQKVKKAISQGNNDIARLYAQNAIRKSNERLNLLRLGSRIDAVASRVQTAVSMRSVTANMTAVVRNMDRAMQTMDMNKISLVMDKFETQFEDLDVATEYYEGATANATATATPQEDVDLLMQKVADESGLEMQQELSNATPDRNRLAATEQKEDLLNERLRALRG